MSPPSSLLAWPPIDHTYQPDRPLDPPDLVAQLRSTPSCGRSRAGSYPGRRWCVTRLREAAYSLGPRAHYPLVAGLPRRQRSRTRRCGKRVDAPEATVCLPLHHDELLGTQVFVQSQARHGCRMNASRPQRRSGWRLGMVSPCTPPSPSPRRRRCRPCLRRPGRWCGSQPSPGKALLALGTERLYRGFSDGHGRSVPPAEEGALVDRFRRRRPGRVCLGVKCGDLKLSRGALSAGLPVYF
jgi:hypothetical protein